jgi:hypothetical protein
MFSSNSYPSSHQGPRYQTIPTNEVDLNAVENNSFNQMNNNHGKVNKWKYLLVTFGISVVSLMFIFTQGGAFSLNGIFGCKTSFLSKK